MTCTSVQALLPLSAGGDLPKRRAERVRRHLEVCADCAALSEAYRESRQWLRAAPGPSVGGAELEQMRRAVWYRIERQPPMPPLRLAVERFWSALRQFAGQPSVALAAVGLVVVGSVALTRTSGLGGSRLSTGLEVMPHPTPDDSVEDNAGPEIPDDPEMVLASATPKDMADGAETGEGEPGSEMIAEKMRIEIQTQDPNVRIIWFAPPAPEEE